MYHIILIFGKNIHWLNGSRLSDLRCTSTLNVNRNAGSQMQQENSSSGVNDVDPGVNEENTNIAQDTRELKKLVRSFIVSDNQDISQQGNELDYFIVKYQTQMVNEYVELRKEYMQNSTASKESVDHVRKLLIVKGRNVDKFSKNVPFTQEEA